MKPRISLTVYILGALIIVGLVALWYAAYDAFSITSGRDTQAALLAILIEAGAIAELLALVDNPKDPYAKLGAGISFVVSISYNYIQASNHTVAHNIVISEPLLVALAIGPLSVVFTLALVMGRAIRAHREAAAKWDADRRKAVASDTIRQEEREDRRRLEELKSLERIEKARIRASVKAQKASEEPPKLPEELPKPSEELPKLPEGIIRLPKSKKDFDAMVKLGEANPHVLTSRVLKEAGVTVTERAIGDWLRPYKKNGDGNV